MKAVAILLSWLVIFSMATDVSWAQTEERKVLYYTCGMHPSVRVTPAEFAKGKENCPICNMKLVPVYKEVEAEEEAKGPIVRLTEREIALAGVRTEEVTKRHLFKEIYTVGRIAYDPKLRIAQEEYLQALETKKKVKSSSFPEVIERADELLESTKIKLRLLGMSEAQIGELERKRKVDTSLILPEEKVWVYADIYEYDLGWVKEGVKISASTEAYPAEVFHGVVIAIDPVVNPKTRSVRIRAELDNPQLKLKPEMYVKVFIHAMLMDKEGAHKGVLAVPKAAVLDTGVRKLVYVDLGDGRFLGREVKLGPEAVSLIEGKKEKFYPVISGLEEEEKVVTRANFLIDSQSQLTGPAAAVYGGALEAEEERKAPPVHQH